MSWGTKCSIAAKGETAWKSLKDRSRRDDLRVGHDVGSERHVCRQGRRVGSARRTHQAPHSTGELESSAFDIDNGPPAVNVTASRPANGRRTTIQFEVRDEWSSIPKVEYSLDAQRWQVVYPRDGIFDSRNEQFELTLESADAAQGPHHPRLRREEQLRDQLEAMSLRSKAKRRPRYSV